MYAFIEGIVDTKTSGELVLAAGGVGYRLIASQAVLSGAPGRGESFRVYTWLNVRDDALELFGFCSLEEKNLFLRLTGISGIGPRTAMGILNSMPLKELTLAIITGDTAMLSRAQGVGKKTAQRIALELKDKLSLDAFGEDLDSDGPRVGESGATDEAVLALLSLGYTRGEVLRAVSTVRAEAGDGAGADDIVRLALRGMMKG